MKLLLCLLMTASAHGMLNFAVPSELTSYKNFIEKTCADFTRDLEMLKEMYEKEGTSDRFTLRMGIFCRTFATRALQQRQMSVYCDSLMTKSMQSAIPFMEKVIINMYTKAK